MSKRADGWYWICHYGEWRVALWEGDRGEKGTFEPSKHEAYVHEDEVEVGERIVHDPNPRRTKAAVNACKGISTDRLEKMVPGTLANLLTLKGEK